MILTPWRAVAYRRIWSNVYVGGNPRPRIWPGAASCAPDSFRRPPPPPNRIDSDATGEGGVAILAYCPDSEAPFLLQSQANQALGHLAPTTKNVFIFELFAAVATIFAHEYSARSFNEENVQIQGDFRVGPPRMVASSFD